MSRADNQQPDEENMSVAGVLDGTSATQVGGVSGLSAEEKARFEQRQYRNPSDQGNAQHILGQEGT